MRRSTGTFVVAAALAVACERPSRRSPGMLTASTSGLVLVAGLAQTGEGAGVIGTGATTP